MEGAEVIIEEVIVVVIREGVIPMQARLFWPFSKGQGAHCAPYKNPVPCSNHAHEIFFESLTQD